ncbi:MAG: hypothetical protein IPG00_22040 [Saprospiraceae bacterium]|nr:hypothetical protein [Saprospiraceae bacterium]
MAVWLLPIQNGAVLIPPAPVIPADGVFLIGCSTTDSLDLVCGTGINGNRMD